MNAPTRGVRSRERCAVALAVALAGCAQPGTDVQTYRSTAHVVLLDPALGWNDVILNGSPAAVIQPERRAVVLNLPASLEAGRTYAVYPGAPSLPPWQRPPDQIGIASSADVDGPAAATGTVTVRDWQTSSGGVFVDLEPRNIRVVSGGGSITEPLPERVTFWAFRGAHARDTEGDVIPSTRLPSGG